MQKNILLTPSWQPNDGREIKRFFLWGEWFCKMATWWSQKQKVHKTDSIECYLRTMYSSGSFSLCPVSSHRSLINVAMVIALDSTGQFKAKPSKLRHSWQPTLLETKTKWKLNTSTKSMMYSGTSIMGNLRGLLMQGHESSAPTHWLPFYQVLESIGLRSSKNFKWNLYKMVLSRSFNWIESNWSNGTSCNLP